LQNHWYTATYIERSGWMSFFVTGTWNPCQTKRASDTLPSAHTLHKFDAQWPLLFSMTELVPVPCDPGVSLFIRSKPVWSKNRKPKRDRRVSWVTINDFMLPVYWNGKIRFWNTILSNFKSQHRSIIGAFTSEMAAVFKRMTRSLKEIMTHCTWYRCTFGLQ